MPRTVRCEADFVMLSAANQSIIPKFIRKTKQREVPLPFPHHHAPFFAIGRKIAVDFRKTDSPVRIDGALVFDGNFGNGKIVFILKLLFVCLVALV